MSLNEIKKALREVLKEPEVKDDLLSTVNERLDMIAAEVVSNKQDGERRFDEIDLKNKGRDDKMVSIEAMVNKHEQSTRENRTIITGLHSPMTEEKVVENMNNLLSCKITEEDIAYIQNLRVPDTQASNRKNKVRVVFHDEEFRNKWYKCKTELKGKNIWLSDDLTPFGSGIAYLARKAKKEQKIQKTWIFRGRIFIIKNGESTATIVSCEKDIPK